MSRILLAAVAVCLSLTTSHGDAALPERAAAPSELEVMRQLGDLDAQRLHAWRLFAQMLQPNGGSDPSFESWHGEGEVFSKETAKPRRHGIRGFFRAGPSAVKGKSSVGKHTAFPNAPVLAYTLYNPVAYEHIRSHHLNRRSELERLRGAGPVDREFATDRSIPPFPMGAVVIKTIWWPVAASGVTALPVWDVNENPPRQSGNNYLQWQRAIVIDPALRTSEGSYEQSVEFVGRLFPKAATFGLASFYHILVDARLAKRLNQDYEARRASLISIGRPVSAGDYLVLVGINLATKEIENWVWASLWWHDDAHHGVYAADRPATMQSAWGHYHMQVAFDAEKPIEPDGGPHICFNPWLEARFPDGGQGGGVVSNCLACHRRASYPYINFLPITRGAPNLADLAYQPGRLRTGFLWSIALHATP